MSSSKRLIFLPYVGCSLLATAFVADFEARGEFSVVAAALKVFPILYLMLFVKSFLDTDGDPLWASRDRQKSRQDSQKSRHESRQKDSQKSRQEDSLALLLRRRRLAAAVLCGLGFSAAGDVAILMRMSSECCLIVGTVLFGVAHVFYIRGMGFERVSLRVGAALVLFALVLSAVLLSGESLVLRIVLSSYSVFLATAAWRAVDRAKVEDGRSRAQKTLLVAGFASFIASDASIGLSTFVSEEVIVLLLAKFVLLSYYAAQGLIVLGVA